MAAVGPSMCCQGPIEAKIFWAACKTPLNRSYGGSILPRLAKTLRNLIQEQNRPSQEDLRTAVGPWVGCEGPTEASSRPQEG